MRIFAHVHTYGHNATSGADKMMQSLLEFLASKDCIVSVGVDNCPASYVLNGVAVISNRYMIAEQYEAADIIFIHLIFNDPALAIARRFNKPIVHVAHNAENRVNEGYVIYNTETLRNELKMDLPSIIVNPPTYVKDWENSIDHFYQPYITLVNCCSNKGGEILKSLATWMPNYKFLGVIGNYGKQMRQPVKNITYRPFSEKMNYDDTRILIVPSKKESWSLCAAEAMASGIPVICSDLPGLRENCGDAAIYCPQSVGNWKIAIELLNNYDQYIERVAMGYTIVEDRNLNDHPEQLENMYNFIREIVKPKEKIEVPADGQRPKEKKEIKPKKEKRVYGTYK